MDRRLLDLWMAVPGLLNLALCVDDGFSVEVTGPSNHVGRDLSALFGENSLDSGNSLPQDKEHDMRSDRPNVVDPRSESDRSAFTSAGERFKRV